jgi:hypothetical protein
MVVLWSCTTTLLIIHYEWILVEHLKIHGYHLTILESGQGTHDRKKHWNSKKKTGIEMTCFSNPIGIENT